MTALIEMLRERKDDFNFHLQMAKSLDTQLFEGQKLAIGDVQLTVRHLMTIKSGMIIHLYNIVEAVMSRTIEEVGIAAKCIPPDSWSNETLREWLRFNASIGLEGTEKSRLEIVHKAALKLLKKDPIEVFQFKKPSGTWSDALIYEFSERLNVGFKLKGPLARKIKKAAKYGEQSPLEFLAKRRNAIAHGERSFEDGAGDLTLQDIEELSEVTIDYLESAVMAFQKFVDDKSYMVVSA